MNRVILIVLDSVGMGEAPDADKFGDVGSSTLGHIAKHRPNLKIDNLKKLGLGNIDGMQHISSIDSVVGCYGRLTELSDGKDTIIGHWEIAGIETKVPFQTYPNGFPKEIRGIFEALIGRRTIGNIVASGTQIINEYGEEHINTGSPIIYTSADSVLQIAAHEDVIRLEELYDICDKARQLFRGEYNVARVIARPFMGEPGNFARTSNRRDYAVDPARPTVLDNLKAAGHNVSAVGKIEDIFNKNGILEAVHTVDNQDGVNKTLEYMQENKGGLIFTNLVDFDMKWGHRRDVEAYANGLEEFDARLPEIMEQMTENDILLITADHGCDPTFKGTDHTREFVPLLVYGKGIKKGVNLGTRETFADIAQTISDIFKLEKTEIGTSFLKEII